MESSHKKKSQPWRVLEFFSGIGGMRYSMMKAGINSEIVEAFDINDVANDVYEHNFSHRPFQGNIQNLTAANLDSYEADAWLLSPPCQPYTRQGLKKHSDDARAFSFLKILDLIPHTSRPPAMLFVENVVGFETSDTHTKMIETLEKSGYVVQEFILSPLQFGVPYSRPRYFCLAKLKPSSFQHPLYDNQLLLSPRPLFELVNSTAINEHNLQEEDINKLLQSCDRIENFLDAKNLWGQTGKENSMLDGVEVSNDESRQCNQSSSLEQYTVPVNLIERWGSAMDIVYPDSKRCCCFTKSYYRYVKGTGSLLATVQPKNKGDTSLKELCLRYFTPREVANFHSFPEDFRFPEHITLRQRYALLGNSLSVAVVGPLLRYLFTQKSSIEH